MIACKTGDVVLVRFPFTDMSSAKQRPAIVVSTAAFAARHGDLVLLALTSRPQSDDSTSIDAWREAGLPKPTWIKPLIATISASMVIRSIGCLPIGDWPRAREVIRGLIAEPFRVKE